MYLRGAKIVPGCDEQVVRRAEYDAESDWADLLLAMVWGPCSLLTLYFPDALEEMGGRILIYL